MPKEKKLTTEDRIWAAVSYLWIISIIALAARKNNEFVKFHASQGVLLFVISIVLTFIPVIGWMVNIIIAIIAIVAIIKALKEEEWEIPLLSGTAQKFGDWIIKSLKL